MNRIQRGCTVTIGPMPLHITDVLFEHFAAGFATFFPFFFLKIVVVVVFLPLWTLNSVCLQILNVDFKQD